MVFCLSFASKPYAIPPECICQNRLIFFFTPLFTRILLIFATLILNSQIKWLTLFLTTAPLAELALMSVRLKLSPKVISIKSMPISAPIAAPVLMYVRLKQFILHNFTRYKQILKKPVPWDRLFNLIEKYPPVNIHFF